MHGKFYSCKSQVTGVIVISKNKQKDWKSYGLNIFCD